MAVGVARSQGKYLVDFGAQSIKNLFVVDSESSINFLKLAPLGFKNDSITSSTKVFHSLHAGHLPTHFVDS